LASNGNSNTKLYYTYTDNNPPAGKQYYRLRQIDIDDKSTYSPVVIISGNQPATLSIEGVFPNPANKQLNVLINSPAREKVTVVVMDLAGRIMLQKVQQVEAGSNTVPVNVNSLSRGNYLIKAICTANCESVISRFIKE
jgi:hypothetical protein